MNYIRVILYFVFGLVALTLWNTWQHDYPATPQLSTTAELSTTDSTFANAAELPSDIANHLNMSSTTTLPISTQTPITIKTDVLAATIDPVGGNIVTAQLLGYPATLQSAEIPFTLLNNNADTLYIAQTGITNVPGLNTEMSFTAPETQYQLLSGQNQLVVNLTWQNAGLKVIKTYTFTRNSYAININYSVINNGNQVWQGRYYMQTKRRNFQEAATKDHLVGFHTFFGIAVSTPTKPYEKYSFNSLSDEPLTMTVKGGWLAILQHYFLSAWIPNPNGNYYYYSQQLDNQVYVVGLISQPLQVSPKQTVSFGSQLYIGPEIASQLETVAPHLGLTVDYGWLWIIAVAIFWLLKHVYSMVGNWGWSIVIVTLLIKLLFYKLSETSYKSMAKMRSLQPKLEVIKERCGGDRQQLSKATMELYRKEKVNPLGGCLPILIQIPVFIALYWVLIESVELRQAPFIL